MKTFLRILSMASPHAGHFTTSLFSATGVSVVTVFLNAFNGSMS
jgi:hypothetical protein